jgi:hypothetical protein
MDDTGRRALSQGETRFWRLSVPAVRLIKILILSGATEGSLRKIVAMAKERGIVVQETDRHSWTASRRDGAPGRRGPRRRQGVPVGRGDA